jgi:hypothetical protein
LLSSKSGQRFEHTFSSDPSSRNDDPVVNHSGFITSTDGHGFFARPSDTLSLPCSIWNSSSSAKSWSSWLVHRIARLWNGPAGQFYILRNRRNLLTLKGGVDPSRRFGGRREREQSFSGSASPSPRVNPRYKGKSPKPFHASAAAAAASKPSRSKRVRSDSPPSTTSNKRTSGNAAAWLYVLNVPQKLSMRTIREEVSKRCDQDQLVQETRIPLTSLSPPSSQAALHAASRLAADHPAQYTPSPSVFACWERNSEGPLVGYKDTKAKIPLECPFAEFYG